MLLEQVIAGSLDLQLNRVAGGKHYILSNYLPPVLLLGIYFSESKPSIKKSKRMYHMNHRITE